MTAKKPKIGLGARRNRTPKDIGAKSKGIASESGMQTKRNSDLLTETEIELLRRNAARDLKKMQATPMFPGRKSIA